MSGYYGRKNPYTGVIRRYTKDELLTLLKRHYETGIALHPEVINQLNEYAQREQDDDARHNMREIYARTGITKKGYPRKAPTDKQLLAQRRFKRMTELWKQFRLQNQAELNLMAPEQIKEIRKKLSDQAKAEITQLGTIEPESLLAPEQWVEETEYTPLLRLEEPILEKEKERQFLESEKVLLKEQIKREKADAKRIEKLEKDVIILKEKQKKSKKVEYPGFKLHKPTKKVTETRAPALKRFLDIHKGEDTVANLKKEFTKVWNREENYHYYEGEGIVGGRRKRRATKKFVLKKPLKRLRGKKAITNKTKAFALFYKRHKGQGTKIMLKKKFNTLWRKGFGKSKPHVYRGQGGEDLFDY
jgi:hypothetical protein